MGIVAPRQPNAFESLSVMFLTEAGMLEDQVKEMCEQIEAMISRPDTPELYHNLHVWTARKPGGEVSSSPNSSHAPKGLTNGSCLH